MPGGNESAPGHGRKLKMKLQDIAKLAGVSKAAVSLALNNKPGISDVTRKKILKIVEETGYTPSSMVRTDQIHGSSKAFRFLACIKADIVSPQFHATPFFAELIHEIERECRTLGYNMLFSTLKGGSIPKDIETLRNDHSSSGTILLGDNLTPDEVKLISDYEPKLVVINTNFEVLNVECVVMNNMMGAYSAANYLIELGHRNLGYAQGIARINNFEVRRQGFLAALKDGGLELPAANLYTVHSEFGASREQFRDIFSRRSKPLPSAIFCENDYIALDLIKALQDSGLKVPKDVSVVGFDDISHCTIISPELTTVHVEKQEMASLAVKRLLAIIENPDLPRLKTFIDNKLVVRNSCCPQRAE